MIPERFYLAGALQVSGVGFDELVGRYILDSFGSRRHWSRRSQINCNSL